MYSNDIESQNVVYYGATTGTTPQQGVVVYPSQEKLSGISPISVRHAFIRKVYSILFVQLLVTIGIATPFVVMDTDTIRDFIGANIWLLWLSLAISFSCMIVFACCPSTLRSYPLNYAIMTLFTCAEGILVGIICSYYTVQSVLVAVGTVAVITLALSVFAIQTKWDFTGWGPYLMVATLVLLIFGFVIGFFPYNSTATKIYCGIGTLIFSFYLIYDTQLIVGGRKNQLSIDDYIIGAMCLYIDIIQLFLYMLTLFGSSR
jgi:protein lifeguard